MREDTNDYENADDDAAARRQALQDELSAGAAPADPAPPTDPAPADPTSQGVTDPDTRAPDPTAPTAPAAPPAAGTPGGATATNPDGTPVGAGIPWNAGTGAPSGTVPGYHWDASYATWIKDAPPAGSGGGAAGAPTGGNLTDPGYAAQLVAYWGNQPGVNPSVKTDPNYWIGRFTSGAFKNDQAYAIQRMMQPEGAPEGAGAPAVKVTGTGTTLQPSSSSGGTPYSMAPTDFPGHPSTDQFGQDIRAQLMALLNQPAVDENDPSIAGAISANRVAQERSLDQERDQIAEAAYAQHLGGAGSTGASYQAARERTGASEGQFAGNLVAQQALSRRNQITQILQIGAGVMTADQQQQLQRELANLDAILRQQSITNQNNQANDRLGFDIGSFQANMNRNAVLDAMGVHL